MNLYVSNLQTNVVGLLEPPALVPGLADVRRSGAAGLASAVTGGRDGGWCAEQKIQLPYARCGNLARSALVHGAALGLVDGEEQRDAAAVRFEHRVAQVKEAAVKGPVGMQGVLPLPGTQLLPIATCDLQVRAKAV